VKERYRPPILKGRYSEGPLGYSSLELVVRQTTADAPYAVPDAWNLIAENVRKSTSIAIFERSLKHFYSSRVRIQRIRDDSLFI